MPRKPLTEGAATIYDARAAWDEGTLEDQFQTTITRAIFHDEKISLQWPSVDGWTTSMELTKSKNKSSIYEGTSVWASATPDQQAANVEATLYSNEIGHVLIGKESWSTGRIDWFVVQFANGRDAIE